MLSGMFPDSHVPKNVQYLIPTGTGEQGGVLGKKLNAEAVVRARAIRKRERFGLLTLASLYGAVLTFFWSFSWYFGFLWGLVWLMDHGLMPF